MENLLKKLQRDYPDISFKVANEFRWSPQNNQVSYDKAGILKRDAAWSLLHEVGHATLKHNTYQSDIELLQIEIAAWEQAKLIGKNYGYEIDLDHIEDCLDSYRDWLHKRSACPTCNNRSLQKDTGHYHCFNCGATWTVSQSRLCRPYRRLASRN